MSTKQSRVDVYINDEQAQAKLADIQAELKQVIILRDKAAAEGNVDAFIKLQKETGKLTKDTEKYKRKVIDVEAVLKNLDKVNLKELRLAISKARVELELIAASDKKAIAAKQKQIATLTTEYNKAKGIFNDQAGFFKRSSVFFNQYFAMISTFIASFTGIILGFRRISEETAKMDDAYSDVMKTTGMTRDKVIELNEEFKKMDTRTAREELNKLAKEAGKLNLKSEKDVLGFVEGGNQIRVALGEDLGADAILLIGKMVDVYKDATNQIQNLELKEQLLAVGSAVNELGASSSANEKYLVDFAGRLGGVSKQAKISIGDIMGFASSLDQDMQQVETSATAFQQFIMKLMGEPAKFAKLAGLEVKAFTKLVSTDANQAIKQFLGVMNDKGGFQQLIPIFDEIGLDGSRAVGVLSSLAGSINKVDVAQKIANKALQEGTSITKEYEIKNNNLAAQKEKAKKQFLDTAIALGEKLSPAMLVSTNIITHLVKVLAFLLEITSKYGVAIVSAGVTVATYTAILKIQSLWQNRSTAGTLFNTIAIKANTLAKETAIAATNLFAAAQMLLTGNIKGANQAMRIFWATLKLNPYILLASTIIAAAAGIAMYISRSKELTAIEKARLNIDKKVTDSFEDQRTKVELLKKAVEDGNLALWYRKQKLQELQELVPEYTASLTDEGELVNNNKKAIDEYLVSLEKQIKLKAAQEEIEELYRSKRKSEKELLKKESDFERANALFNSSALSSGAGEAAITRQIALTSKLHIANSQLLDAKKELLDITTAINEIENEITENVNTTVVVKTKTSNGGGGGGGNVGRQSTLPSMSKKKSPTEINADLSKAMKEAYEEKKLELLRQRADMTITEEEYKTQMENLELSHNMTLLDMRTKLGLDTIDVETELLKKRIAIREQFTKKETVEIDKRLEKEKEAAKHILQLSSMAGSAIEDYIGGNEDALKAGAKQMISYALDILKVQTQMAIAGATIQSLMQPDSIATFGATGLTRAAVLVGLIEAAFAVAKGFVNSAIEGYESGGYTGYGRNDDVKGLVHANEFVANAQATLNPTVRPVLDIIDRAQRSGTVRSINLPSLIQAEKTAMARAAGYSSAPVQHNDAALMMEAVAEFKKVVQQLQKEGIAATLIYHDFKRMADKEKQAISKTK